MYKLSMAGLCSSTSLYFLAPSGPKRRPYDSPHLGKFEGKSFKKFACTCVYVCDVLNHKIEHTFAHICSLTKCALTDHDPAIAVDNVVIYTEGNSYNCTS